ncbi:MAG: LysR family transcriptional regulator [Betaproteobacteria bacterium]|nr:LysR family transcriptional regulator [Betaproteobacteria bacterium]
MPRTALRRYFRHGLFPQLMVFEAVARHGSVTKAADALHLAQPTVSIQLKKLAETLDLQLFEQRGRQLHLTTAGRELLSACEELIELLLRTESRLAALRAGHADTLRIAALTGARKLAARMLASFCARHPGVQASLNVGNCAELRQRLAAHEDHLFILTLPDIACGMKAYLLATEYLWFYCGPTHSLAGRADVSLSILGGESFVVPAAGSGTRSMLEELLKRVDCALRIRAELESDEAVAEGAVAGLGVALLPTAVAEPFVSAGSLVAVDAQVPSLERVWYLVHPDATPLPAAAILFVRDIELVKDVGLHDVAVFPSSELAESDRKASAMPLKLGLATVQSMALLDALV